MLAFRTWDPLAETRFLAQSCPSGCPFVGTMGAFGTYSTGSPDASRGTPMDRTRTGGPALLPLPSTSPRSHTAHSCEVGWASPPVLGHSVCPRSPMPVPAPRELVGIQAHFPARGPVPGEGAGTLKGPQGPLPSQPRFPHLSSGDNKPWWDDFSKAKCFSNTF